MSKEYYFEDREEIRRKAEDDLNAKYFRQAMYPDMDEGMFDDPFGMQETLGMNLYAKMEVSQPGDPAEVQADAVASAVVSDNVEEAQMELEHNEGEVMAKASDISVSLPGGFEQRLQQLKGSGMSLANDKKEHLEEFMGTELDNVRLHTEDAAKKLSESINARAFAHGDDIFFADDVNDEELLAHEVTHVVQQGNGIYGKIQRQEIKKEPQPPFEFMFAYEKFAATIEEQNEEYLVNIKYLGNKKTGDVDIGGGVVLPSKSFVLFNLKNASKGPVITGFFGNSLFIDTGEDHIRNVITIKQKRYDPASSGTNLLVSKDPADFIAFYFQLSTDGISGSTGADALFIYNEGFMSQTEDFTPGMRQDPEGNLASAITVLIDGDGDQVQDLLMIISMPDVKSNTLNIVLCDTLNFKNSYKHDITLDGIVADQFRLLFKVRTDGHIPNEFFMYRSNTAKEESWKVYPIQYKDGKRFYKMEVGDQAFDAELPGNASLQNVFSVVKEPTQALNTTSMDVAFGLYRDRFRLIFQQVSDSNVQLHIFGYMEGQDYTTLGYGDPIQLSTNGALNINVVDTGSPVEFAIDLNCDDKPDLVIYDRVTSSYTGDLNKGMADNDPQFQRYHIIRVLGNAVTREQVRTYKIVRGEFVQYNSNNQGFDKVKNQALFNYSEDFRPDEESTVYSWPMEVAYRLGNIESLRQSIKEAKDDDGNLVVDPGASYAWLIYVFDASLAMGQPDDGDLYATCQSSQDIFIEHLQKDMDAHKGGLPGTNWSVDKSELHAAKNGVLTSGDISDNLLLLADQYGMWFSERAQHAHLVDLTPEAEMVTNAGKMAEYHSLILHELRKIRIEQHVAPVKVTAFHYPNKALDQKLARIDKVPLEIYYWQNKEGDKWEAVDLTRPEQPYYVECERSADQSDPPIDLFSNLNYSKNYMQGMMTLQLQSGKWYTFETEPKKTPADYITDFAMVLLLVGIALTGIGALGELAAIEMAGGLAELGEFYLNAANLTMVIGSGVSLYEDNKSGSNNYTKTLLNVGMVVGAVARLGLSGAGAVINMAKDSNEIHTGLEAWLLAGSKKVVVPLVVANVTADATVCLMMTEIAFEQLKTITENGKIDNQAILLVIFQLLASAAMAATLLRTPTGGRFLDSGVDIIVTRQNGKLVAFASNTNFLSLAAEDVEKEILNLYSSYNPEAVDEVSEILKNKNALNFAQRYGIRGIEIMRKYKGMPNMVDLSRSELQQYYKINLHSLESGTLSPSEQKYIDESNSKFNLFTSSKKGAFRFKKRTKATLEVYDKNGNIVATMEPEISGGPESLENGGVKYNGKPLETLDKSQYPELGDIEKATYSIEENGVGHEGPRDVDAEVKLLQRLYVFLQENPLYQVMELDIRIYTSRASCVSCQDVIYTFRTTWAKNLRNIDLYY